MAGSFIPREFLVKPAAWRIEGPYNCIRPVMSAKDFAAVARKQKNHHTVCPGINPLERTDIVETLEIMALERTEDR